MKSTKKHFCLEPNEYLVQAGYQDAENYEVYFNGEKVNDVVALVRINIESLKKVKK